jgi:HPt (histidine-containing phosphotransfer) domain-containing protein
MEEEVILDEEILEDLKDLADDGEILPMALYNKFFETAEERLDLLKKNLGTKNYSELRNLAHSLKGSSHNLAAIRLGSVAHKMEKSAENQNIEELIEYYEELKIEYQKTKTEILRIQKQT